MVTLFKVDLLTGASLLDLTESISYVFITQGVELQD